MTDADLLPGCKQDVEEVEALIDRAARLTRWSIPTLCHRVVGDREFPVRLREGRLSLNRLKTAKGALEQFIREKAGENQDG